MLSSRAFLTRFHEFCLHERLVEERDRIIVAVSGGIDSTVLLDLLAKDKGSFGATVVVAHFNFQMRGDESDEDEEFVAQRARHYGFEFYVERADTNEYARQHKLGIQEAARNLRYEFFDKLLLSSGFDKIATAHNADDNAETIMLNMFRGAGVAGLSGIPVYRPDRRIIRPLLFAERKEIKEYAGLEHLTFRVDSSNLTDHYTRNFIRNKILPLVKEKINPDVVSTVNRSAELFRELEGFLRYTARQNYEQAVTRDSNVELLLSVARLRSNPKLIQQYILMLAAQRFANRTLDYCDIGRILGLTEGLTGSQVTIGKEYVAFRDRDNLVFRKTEEVPQFRFTVVPDKRYQFERFSFVSEIVEPAGITLNGKEAEFIDADKVAGQELILRSWKEGDAFIPLGMKSMKKISDFYVDEKIPIYEKPYVPILETKSGDVVWVCGYRIDDRFKVTTDTRRVMRLEFTTKQ